jgi:hypothetical protein
MINPSLSWHQPQPMGRYPYHPNLESIPKTAGIYLFYRKHGLKYQVFYVGKALRLRSRIKGQLNNLKLMNGIHAAGTGSRFLAYAEVIVKPGQKAATAIHAAEKLMIRHFVDDGHILLNVQGVKIRVQTLNNDRPKDLKLLIPVRTQIEA